MIRRVLVVLAFVALVSHQWLVDTAPTSVSAQDGQRIATVTLPAARYLSLAIDGHQFERWRTDASRLPAGSAVELTPPRLWRDYRSLVIVFLLVGAVQTLLIVALMIERRRRHSAEQDAQHHLANAALLDRRATLGEMSAVLAHELNQPLGAIMHNAEAAEMAIESGRPPLAELREILADIRREDSRAGEIIRRMRALLQKHELNGQPLDVNDFTRETVALVFPAAAEKGVYVDLDLAIGLAPIVGDRVHLQQVLLNVLLNGMDAMAAVPRVGRRLLVRTAQYDHRVEVSVKDAGCGIARDTAARIFEPFYTTKAQGMGVGLSIARSIVEAHGGHIAAENNRDCGATVRFTLPVNRVAQPRVT